jgi:hypothetical protein
MIFRPKQAWIAIVYAKFAGEMDKKGKFLP